MTVDSTELREKKLRGSGGYIIANISDDEQKMANLGGPELFLAGIGRLNKDRISKYYCNKCEKDYKKSPDIIYENPNEQMDDGVILSEKGDYKCTICQNIISQYRKFNTGTQSNTENTSVTNKLVTTTSEKSLINNNDVNLQKTKNSTSNDDIVTVSTDKYFPIQSIIGMPVYDTEAMLVGNVQEVGLRKFDSDVNIILKIIGHKFNSQESSKNDTNNESKEIKWSDISKIGDIVLINKFTDNKKCSSCAFQNKPDALYCEECGNKLQ
ncbi:MAG: hypothetical protein ACPKQO_02895 [Nitrososphaeraceae archaeon]